MNRETLELLREAHNEPISEADYAAVRARVLSKIAEERRHDRWVWAYGFAAAALMVWLAAGWWPPPAGAPRSLPKITPGAFTAAGPVNPPSGKRTPRHRHRPARASYQVVGPPVLQPLVVKLVTSDPDIVIYWISGE
jgi:hypothetical protein